MFPCAMARYIAGFWPEARKYGLFWPLLSANAAKIHPRIDVPPNRRALIRQSKLGNCCSCRLVVQGKEIQRARIGIVGGERGAHE